MQKWIDQNTATERLMCALEIGEPVLSQMKDFSADFMGGLLYEHYLHCAANLMASGARCINKIIVSVEGESW